MHPRPHLVLLLATALCGTGCLVESRPKANPCEPNPCTEAHRTTCAVEEEQARCLCDPGFLSRPSGACEAVSAANCAEHPGDSAEPDDCTARARPLATDGQPKLQSIDPIGDYDFFQFSGSAHHVYVLTATREGPSLLPRVDVYDQGGTWLAAAEGLQKAELAFKARASAPYFARVSHSPVDPSVATGNYSLTLVSLGSEDHGDTSTDATSISPNLFSDTLPRDHYGRFELAGDQDWFAFSGEAGRSYRLLFDSSRGIPNLALYGGGVFDRPYLTAWDDTVDFTLPGGGTVYLVLYPAQGQGSSYAFRFFH